MSVVVRKKKRRRQRRYRHLLFVVPLTLVAILGINAWLWLRPAHLEQALHRIFSESLAVPFELGEVEFSFAEGLHVQTTERSAATSGKQATPPPTHGSEGGFSGWFRQVWGRLMPQSKDTAQAEKMPER